VKPAAELTDKPTLAQTRRPHHSYQVTATRIENRVQATQVGIAAHHRTFVAAHDRAARLHRQQLPRGYRHVGVLEHNTFDWTQPGGALH
jgi:hypothetical protein